MRRRAAVRYPAPGSVLERNEFVLRAIVTLVSEADDGADLESDGELAHGFDADAVMTALDPGNRRCGRAQPLGQLLLG